MTHIETLVAKLADTMDPEGAREMVDAALAEARMLCDGSCDIALARRQVGPDGDVPGNAKECAALWEREASRLMSYSRALAHSMQAAQLELATEHSLRVIAEDRLRMMTENAQSLSIALTRCSQELRDLLEANR